MAGSFQLLTNPASEQALVSYSFTDNATGKLSVVNSLGAMEKEVILKDSQGKVAIPTSELVNGIYQLQIKSSNGFIQSTSLVKIK